MGNSPTYNFRRGFSICLFISLIVTTLMMLFNINYFSFDNLAITFIISTLYSFALGFGNGYLNVFLDHKFDWLKQTNKRIFWGIWGTVLYTIPVIIALNYLVYVYYFKNESSAFFSDKMIWIHVFYILLALLISAFLHAIGFMINWKKATQSEVHIERRKTGVMSSQLESLKSQIDPHFLFNSLNVLTALIDEDPERAQDFTTSLSRVYRYVLEQKDKELVPLSEEIQFAKTYISLLKMRFEDSITVTLPEISNEDAFVVPLSLQLLLENGVKHNVVNDKQPLHMAITLENGFLKVENIKALKSTLKTSNGIGLQSIVSRYELLTNRDVLIDNSATRFTVQLPLLTQKIEDEPLFYSEEDSQLQKAKKQVKELKEFYSHFTAFCIVIPILIIINVLTSSFYWFVFPLLGWGTGITIHALQVFGLLKNWEEKRMNTLINNYKKNKYRN